jgi:putative transposase
VTHRMDDTLLTTVCELLDEYGFDSLAEAMTLVLNETMKVERARHLQAGPYERTAGAPRLRQRLQAEDGP